MKPRGALGCITVALLWVASAVSLPALGQGSGNNTVTTSFSSQVGAINAVYIALQDTVGPGTILVGTLTGCTLVGSPPFPGCSLTSGTGTAGDPFAFNCTGSIPLAGCSGQTFDVLAGTSNLNVQTHTVTAVAAAATQQVPLGPWVPVLSGGGVLLAALVLRRRRR